MLAYHNINNDPNLRIDMMRLLEEGETITGIGRIYGVSRDRVRTQMKRFGLSKIKPRPLFTADEVKQWIEQIVAGETMNMLAERLNITSDKVREYIRKYGHDLEQIKLDRSKHRYDGAFFGDWTVITGSHHKVNGNQVLDCQCVCGLVKTVSLTNLLGGASKSCGCTGYYLRQSFPWICEATGQTVISTAELSRITGIKNLTLHRLAHRNGSAVDNNGNEWIIQLDKGINPGLTRSDTILWINHQTNEQFIGCKAVSEKTNGSINTIKWYGNRRMPYTAQDGSIWNPTTINQIT